MRWLAALALVACQSPARIPPKPDAAPRETGLKLTFHGDPPGATAWFAPSELPRRTTPFVLTLPRDFQSFDVAIKHDGYKPRVVYVQNHGRDEVFDTSLVRVPPPLPLTAAQVRCRDRLAAALAWDEEVHRYANESSVHFRMRYGSVGFRREAGRDSNWRYTVHKQEEECSIIECRPMPSIHSWRRRLNGLVASFSSAWPPAEARSSFRLLRPAIEECLADP
jgi:hypothetical protein